MSLAEYTQSDEGGTHEAISLDDIQSFAEFSRQPCKEDCYYSSTKSGMFFSGICGHSVFLCTRVQLRIKDEPFNKQLEVKMRGTSFLCENL